MACQPQPQSETGGRIGHVQASCAPPPVVPTPVLLTVPRLSLPVLPPASAESAPDPERCCRIAGCLLDCCRGCIATSDCACINGALPGSAFDFRPPPPLLPLPPPSSLPSAAKFPNPCASSCCASRARRRAKDSAGSSGLGMLRMSDSTGCGGNRRGLPSAARWNNPTQQQLREGRWYPVHNEPAARAAVTRRPRMLRTGRRDVLLAIGSARHLLRP